MTKLHKNPISVRPIVSGIGGITERISSFLDHFLQPVLITIPSYLKNSSELIELIKDTHIHTNVTVDVSSLYLNIPQEEGTQAVVNLLEERGALPLPKDIITHMLNIVLKYNIFKFGDSVYRQVKGTAMGTKCAPAFAGIFMNRVRVRVIGITLVLLPFLPPDIDQTSSW